MKIIFIIGEAMSHIHIPDGVMPIWLWLTGYIIIICYVWALGISFKKNSFNKKLPLVGVFVALMIVVMSIEIVPILYHVMLDALAGIILGPVFAVLCFFIVNLFLALIGHGGVTIVGLNTIILSVGAILAYYLFHLLNDRFKNVFMAAFIATVISLFVSTWCSVGIVYLGTQNINYLLHKHEHKADSFFNFELFDHHEKGHEEDNHNIHRNKSPDIHDINNSDHEHHISEDTQHHEKHTRPLRENFFDMKRFIFLIMTFGFIGWTLEGFLTAFIVSYLNKIKPDLLEKTSNENR